MRLTSFSGVCFSVNPHTVFSVLSGIVNGTHSGVYMGAALSTDVNGMVVNFLMPRTFEQYLNADWDQRMVYYLTAQSYRKNKRKGAYFYNIANKILMHGVSR